MGSTPLVSVVTPVLQHAGVPRRVHRKRSASDLSELGIRSRGQLQHRWVERNRRSITRSRFPGKIRLIRTQSFLSQVQNYNFALSCISPSSKYCKMVQADDWLFPDCVKSMVELAEAHPTVGIVAAYELEGDEVRLDGLPYPSPEVSRPGCLSALFLEGEVSFRYAHLFANAVRTDTVAASISMRSGTRPSRTLMCALICSGLGTSALYIRF